MKAKLESGIRWATVEADENGEIVVHIVPVKPVGGFKTAVEASAFSERMHTLGNPVLTDDDDCVVATYVGHTLSKQCICEPEQHKTDAAVWIHRQAN